ncbi:LPXTG cell wall anchor domain-containing protein [Leucobacter manosquensis]|uniref:LPXTG cell wall anchor domain-containing protein n=1 Tax=Leucobacter manosquensis TaxID=2810611 RepID=A0ABS5M6B1_9MICO|nr:LPXTG cell wall anchor domain-containing protein [Leucobacter manosquensis]
MKIRPFITAAVAAGIVLAPTAAMADDTITETPMTTEFQEAEVFANAQDCEATPAPPAPVANSAVVAEVPAPVTDDLSAENAAVVENVEVIPGDLPPEVPADPVDCGTPTIPSLPGDGHIDPIDPVDPVDPVEPVDPVAPVAPVDPVPPVVPADPVEPVAPVDPGVVPGEPVAPVDWTETPNQNMQQIAYPDALATTGGEPASWLGAAAAATLAAGAGLFAFGRRKRGAEAGV